MNHRIRDQEVAPTIDAGECVLCAILGALIAALAVAVLVKVMLFAPPRFTALPLDETCSLSDSACTVLLPDGGRLEFALGPQPVPVLEPLSVELRVANSKIRALEVDFTGVNLPMAFNRADLTPQGEDSYTGKAILPLCANGRMEWRATVRLESGKRQIYVPFRFETGQKNT